MSKDLKRHLKWKGMALCEQRYPDPLFASHPAKVTCVACQHIANDMLRSGSHRDFTTWLAEQENPSPTDDLIPAAQSKR